MSTSYRLSISWDPQGTGTIQEEATFASSLMDSIRDALADNSFWEGNTHEADVNVMINEEEATIGYWRLTINP